MHQFKCEVCGEDFVAKINRAKYCSERCKAKANSARRPARKCENCGKKFIPLSSPKQRFCCMSCALSGVVAHREITCKRCGVSFTHTGRGWRWYCPACTKIRRNERTHEHAVRAGVIRNPDVGSGGAQWGETNHQWKDGHAAGISGYRKRCLSIWPEECVACGNDIRVVVHHIDGNDRNLDPHNLIPLCASCHVKVHRRLKPTIEQYYASLEAIWPDCRIKIEEKIGDALARGVIRPEGSSQKKSQGQRLAGEPATAENNPATRPRRQKTKR